MDISVTFHSLLAQKNNANISSDSAYPLPKWFTSMYDVPLKDFSVEDIARACRQNLFPEAIVPFCMTILESDPIAGEMYEGELLLSLRGVSMSFWLEFPEIYRSLRKLLLSAKDRIADKGTINDMNDFLKSLDTIVYSKPS